MMIPLAFGMPGPIEMIAMMAVGLLLFGKRLPEVGRSIGQTVVQFKKGLSEATEEINKPTPAVVEPPKQILDQTTSFKFDPHTGEPINRAETVNH